jgi:hypothetical protein
MQNSCNTVYTGNMVCFRYIIVNILHKGDNKDDDDDDNNNNNVCKCNSVMCQLELHRADCCSASKPRTEF